MFCGGVTLYVASPVPYATHSVPITEPSALARYVTCGLIVRLPFTQETV